jgi:hypothetical protein
MGSVILSKRNGPKLISSKKNKWLKATERRKNMGGRGREHFPQDRFGGNKNKKNKNWMVK